jgi:nucleoside-diphosphate-sugar epimerase
MKNVLILGANGQIANEVIKLFLEEADIKLTLFLRQEQRLNFLENNSQICIVEGDVLNLSDLEKAMENKDVVYANLAGDLKNHVKNIIKAMKNTGLQRLIFISSIGIYDEVLLI